MTAASLRLSRQCGLGCSVQSQKRLYSDAGEGGGCGGGGGGVPVLSHRPVCGRCGCPGRPDRRIKAHTGRRASCIGLISMSGRWLSVPTRRGARAPARSQALLLVSLIFFLYTGCPA